ncbi:type II toxin-antitoxin system death-on-curing family toxin [Peribacillus aracenensis]|uniref:type II toxin-antitoxin system death-on-curing family toxin n=1 Tax=Peribacillus aracenensis TaxID=2976708 RepID=UPI0021A40A1F|nr:type II toxin-antitoxin system death-on-curing family toxin [Peribacillus sp. BBB004]
MTFDIIYLSTNQIIAINAIQIKVYSPTEQIGVKDPGLLDSAVNRPRQTVFENDAYPSIHEKAGALFESISKNHSFHNANKRTALIMFLKINHYKWLMGIEDEQDFVVDVVNHKYDFKAIARIIQENIKPL